MSEMLQPRDRSAESVAITGQKEITELANQAELEAARVTLSEMLEDYRLFPEGARRHWIVDRCKEIVISDTELAATKIAAKEFLRMLENGEIS